MFQFPQSYNTFFNINIRSIISR